MVWYVLNRVDTILNLSHQGTLVLNPPGPYGTTNLGVGNTMVSLKITENVIIKVLLAILGSWRWGPYGGPDL
jgi:hypothetical protein